MPYGSTYEAYEDSLFLLSELFEHAWELGFSDGFGFYAFEPFMQRRQTMSGVPLCHSETGSGSLDWTMENDYSDVRQVRVMMH